MLFQGSFVVLLDLGVGFVLLFVGFGSFVVETFLYINR